MASRSDPTAAQLARQVASTEAMAALAEKTLRPGSTIPADLKALAEKRRKAAAKASKSA